jgi:hypothetical protein
VPRITGVIVLLSSSYPTERIDFQEDWEMWEISKLYLLSGLRGLDGVVLGLGQERPIW